MGVFSSLFLGLSVIAHSVQDLEEAGEMVPFQIGSFLMALASLIVVIHVLGDKKRKHLFRLLMIFIGDIGLIKRKYSAIPTPK